MAGKVISFVFMGCFVLSFCVVMLTWVSTEKSSLNQLRYRKRHDSPKRFRSRRTK